MGILTWRSTLPRVTDKKLISQTRVHRTEALAVVRKLVELYERGDKTVCICCMSNGKVHVMGESNRSN